MSARHEGMRRATLLLAALLLCAGPVSAALISLGGYSIESPRIVVSYTKEVSLRNFSIISSDAQHASEYALDQVSPAPLPGGAPAFSSSYTLATRSSQGNSSASEPLAPGEYQLTLDAVDRSGVRTLDAVNFQIVGLDIQLVQPRFGVAPSQPFDLYFVTLSNGQPAQAHCEYSKIGFDAPLTAISSGFTSDHIIPALNYRGSIYLICEEESGRKTSERIPIDWDTTPPIINASASPSLVRDPRDKSAIVAVSTDEDTVCSIDGAPFPGEGSANRSAYSQYHETRVSYDSISDTQQHVVAHAISCVDLAGRASSAQLNVTVDFGQFSDIQVLSPAPLTNLSAFDLVVEPTFAADTCAVGNSTMQASGSLFTAHFSGLADGSYTMHLACDGVRSAQRDYNLTVDATPPTLLLNASQLLCAGAISARWNASDASGIRSYTYRVSDTSGTLAQGTTIQGGASLVPTRRLSGALHWEVLATDNAGNGALQAADIPDLRDGQEEECGLPPFIRIVQPPLGFALASPYTLTLATPAASACRYSLQPGVDWDGRVPLSTSDGRTHVTPALTFADQQLYVWCQEPSLKNHTRTVRVGVDTSAPSIAVTASPNPVVDPSRKVVVLTVTTSDPTSCAVNGANMDGDPADPATFSTNHAAAIDLRSVTSQQPMDIPYSVTCENLAGLSATSGYIVHVDLGATLTIAKLSPDDFTSNDSVVLAVRPNLDSTCSWKPALDNGTMRSFDAVVNNTHSVTLGHLDDGTYQYSVACTSAAQSGTSLVSFVVDRSVPTISGLSGPAVLCGRGDYAYNISGISTSPVVAYSVANGTGALLAGNTTSATITLSTTSLPPGDYTLSATPLSRSGAAGSPETLAITFARGGDAACGASEGHCGNGAQDTGETGVDCGGTCSSACLACSLDTECPLTMTCEGGACVPLPQITPGAGGGPGQNGTVTGPPIGTSPDTCESDFQCSLDEQCVDGTCQKSSTQPQPTPDGNGTPDGTTPTGGGSHWLAITFIAFGVLVMGGSGFYLRSHPGHDTLSYRGPNFAGTPAMPTMQPRMPPPLPQSPQRDAAAQAVAQQRAQAEDEERARSLAREKAMEQARDRASERSDRRHDAFRAFGEQEAGTARQQRPEPAPARKQPKAQAPQKGKGKKADADDGGEEDVFDKLEKL